jgi:hypothetical protein
MSIRDKILEIADHYARAGEDWETGLLAGASEPVTRAEALEIATWLECEAPVEYGPDDRYAGMARDIRSMVLSHA